MKAQIIESSPTIDQKLDSIISIVGDMNKRLTNLETDMQEVKIRLDTVEERLNSIDIRIDNINLSLSDRIERLGQGLNKRIDTFYIVLISTLLAWGGMLIAILKLWK